MILIQIFQEITFSFNDKLIKFNFIFLYFFITKNNHIMKYWNYSNIIKCPHFYVLGVDLILSHLIVTFLHNDEIK